MSEPARVPPVEPAARVGGARVGLVRAAHGGAAPAHAESAEAGASDTPQTANAEETGAAQPQPKQQQLIEEFREGPLNEQLAQIDVAKHVPAKLREESKVVPSTYHPPAQPAKPTYEGSKAFVFQPQDRSTHHATSAPGTRAPRSGQS